MNDAIDGPRDARPASSRPALGMPWRMLLVLGSLAAIALLLWWRAEAEPATAPASEPVAGSVPEPPAEPRPEPSVESSAGAAIESAAGPGGEPGAASTVEPVGRVERGATAADAAVDTAGAGATDVEGAMDVEGVADVEGGADVAVAGSAPAGGASDAVAPEVGTAIAASVTREEPAGLAGPLRRRDGTLAIRELSAIDSDLGEVIGGRIALVSATAPGLVMLADGRRFVAGARMPNGHVIAAIERGQIVLERDGVVSVVRLP